MSSELDRLAKIFGMNVNSINSYNIKDKQNKQEVKKDICSKCGGEFIQLVDRKKCSKCGRIVEDIFK